MQERQNLSRSSRPSCLRQKTQQRNHPAKGSSIKVEPIRDLRAIAKVKSLLVRQPRNLCLFTIGINTAYRASELLSLHVGDVAHLKVGDSIDIKQLKNQKYRRATLNGEAYRALQSWLDVHPDPKADVPLFRSQKGGALSVSAVNQLVKKWCRTIELQGNYGSHSMRKSWGYHQRMQLDTPVALLMRAYGHATEMQTLEYLCIQPEELKSLYLKMEL